MNRISSFFGRTAPEAKAAEAVVPAKTENKKEIYFRNEKGWSSYNIELLTNGALCDVANTECRAEAGYERNRAITAAIGGTLLVVGVMIAAVVVAKIASLFFVVSLLKISTLNASSFHPLTYFVTRVLTHTATYIGAGILIYKLWSSTYGSIQDHWEAAKHLDDLGIKALLRKASFEQPEIVAKPERSSTSIDWT